MFGKCICINSTFCVIHFYSIVFTEHESLWTYIYHHRYFFTHIVIGYFWTYLLEGCSLVLFDNERTFSGGILWLSVYFSATRHTVLVRKYRLYIYANNIFLSLACMIQRYQTVSAILRTVLRVRAFWGRHLSHVSIVDSGVLHDSNKPRHCQNVYSMRYVEIIDHYSCKSSLYHTRNTDQCEIKTYVCP